MSQPLTKLSELLLSVDSPAGRERVACYLEALPFPHYRPHPNKPRLLERIDESGVCAVGRFVGREFVVLNSERE